MIDKLSTSKYKITFLLLVVSLTVYCQNRQPQSESTDTTVLDTLPVFELPDTLVLRYHHIDDPTTFYDYQDTTLDNFYHHYDQVKRRDIDFLNLGNAGSASRPMVYSPAAYIGYRSGLDQYSVYNLTLEKFKFFDNNVPFSHVAFTPVSSQENFVVKANFSRKFAGSTVVSLNYDRARQVGFYTNQLTKNTNFGASLKVQSKDQKYTGFITIISNVAEEGNNGGVMDTSLYDQPLYGDRSNIPVFSSDGQTRHQQKQYSLVNYYALNAPFRGNTQILLRYDFAIDRRYQKFYDDNVSADQDSVNYKSFRTENRGIRFYNRENIIKNALYSYLSDGDRLNIRLGLVYDRYDIDQQSITSGYDNVYLDFKGKVPLTKSLDIDAQGKLGIGDGSGDFLAKGSLSLNLGKYIEMTGGVSFYRYSPSLIHRQLVLNGNIFWQNNFTKPVGTDLFADLNLPSLNLRLKLTQSVVSNVLYWNEDVIPIQNADVFSATSISLSHNLKVGKLGLDNYLLFQFFSENLFHLPPLHSKHNLYLQGWLFKRALLARIGSEIRLTPNYTGAEYNPVVGGFFPSQTEIPLYPMLDVYFTGKIDKFRIFLRAENLTAFFNDNVTYQTVWHPQFDGKIRFGVSWLLLN